MKETRIYIDKSDLAQAFSEFLIQEIESSSAINIAISGGSTPKVIFDYLSTHYPEKEYWSKVKFFWVDERCVDPSDEQSNFRMTKAHLFDNIEIPQENIFRIKGEDEPMKEANRYSNLLDELLDCKEDIPAFDLVILGMGDDGHTASIFPHEIELFYDDSNCVVATHPQSGQKRISISGKLINNATKVAVLATGATKSSRIKEVFAKKKSAETLPIALVNPDSNNLIWFLDKDASSGVVFINR